MLAISKFERYCHILTWIEFFYLNRFVLITGKVEFVYFRGKYVG